LKETAGGKRKKTPYASHESSAKKFEEDDGRNHGKGKERDCEPGNTKPLLSRTQSTNGIRNTTQNWASKNRRKSAGTLAEQRESEKKK